MTQPTLVSSSAKPARAESPARALSFDLAGATDIGKVRERNEDSYLIANLQRSLVVHSASPETAKSSFSGQSEGTLLVVADGMGGEGGGDLASRVAVETIAGYLLNVMPWVATRANGGARAPSQSLTGVRDQLSSALVAGDTTIKRAGAQAGTPRMGTTLTMAFISWPVLYVAHVGDSRCYLLRDGALSRLTKDHTLAQQMVDQGIGNPRLSSEWHHVLWNSLGGSAAAPEPETAKLELHPNDVLLLCSDGLTKHVPDETIAAVLASNQPAQRRATELVRLANEAGGSDNTTVVVGQPTP